MSDICRTMKTIQTTTFLLVPCIFGAALLWTTLPSAVQAHAMEASERHSAGPAAPDLLGSIGMASRTIRLEGTLTTTGQPTINLSGAPFWAIIDTTDRMLLNMGGPFGMTAGRMVVDTQQFVMVNYLVQEVWDGDPDADEIKAQMHLPVTPTDLLALLRGRVPGNVERFSIGPARNDGRVLFQAQHPQDGLAEYALIDSTTKTLVQYQLKGAKGVVHLDVRLNDYQVHDGERIPHRVTVATKKRSQTATIEITDVELDIPITAPLDVDVPSSFTRRTLR